MTTPDPETRLHSVLGALRDVVIPALPETEVLAIEQATLCASALAILCEQFPYLADYEARSLADTAALGAALVEDTGGGPHTAEAVSTLRSRLADSGRSIADTPAATADTRTRRNDIGLAVDQVVRAVSVDGAPGARAAVGRYVTRHGAQQARRDRTWFRSAGMDPDPGTLGTVASLVEEVSR